MHNKSQARFLSGEPIQVEKLPYTQLPATRLLQLSFLGTGSAAPASSNTIQIFAKGCGADGLGVPVKRGI